MKNAAGGVVVALLLFAVALACWSEANVSRGVAEAHRRLATLHYDADDGLDEVQSIWSRLPWPGGSSTEDIQRRRTSVAYWRKEFTQLNDMMLATGTEALTDATRMLVTANASFRTSMPEQGDRRSAVARLDSVIQSYADVLRRDGNAIDAAYNYEYVTRLRDSIAKGPERKPTRDGKDAKDARTAVPAENTTPDLPAGVTIHGRPGGPPPDTDMSDFKTISPMRYDEREEQTDPGRGKTFQRKG